LAKVNSELQQYRSKYESEGLARAEELEEAKTMGDYFKVKDKLDKLCQ
jgi:hypothetical protein